MNSRLLNLIKSGGRSIAITPRPIVAVIKPRVLSTVALTKLTTAFHLTPSHEPALLQKRKRVITDYKDNYSASLGLPIEEKEFYKNRDNIPYLLAESESRILEHSARRIDLFFYTLVAYYNKKVKVIQGSTHLQHGKGRALSGAFFASTQAAHSSFITAPLNTHTLHEESILNDLHLFDSLNSTVEIPAFANMFDSLVEERYKGRSKAYVILQKVSDGEITPIQGLHAFLLMLKEIFSLLEANKEAKTEAQIPAKEKLLKLIRQGSLINKLSLDGQSVAKEYIYMLLRLKPAEITLCKASIKTHQKIIVQKLIELQEEIFASKSAFKNRG